MAIRYHATIVPGSSAISVNHKDFRNVAAQGLSAVDTTTGLISAHADTSNQETFAGVVNAIVLDQGGADFELLQILENGPRPVLIYKDPSV